MLVILDYGMGNPHSIFNMVKKVGGNATISVQKDDLLRASGIILPGVGSFDNGIDKIRSCKIFDLLEEKVFREKVPFLGICLGMQLLFEGSQEGQKSGFGWLKGEVKRFDFSNLPSEKRLKIPHMGWNQVQIIQNDSIFRGMDKNEDTRFYFVHSYYVNSECSEHIASKSFYGIEFASSIQKNNIYGVQFHPEKSHKFGMALIKNFLGIIDAKS